MQYFVATDLSFLFTSYSFSLLQFSLASLVYEKEIEIADITTKDKTIIGLNIFPYNETFLHYLAKMSDDIT